MHFRHTTFDQNGPLYSSIKGSSTYDITVKIDFSEPPTPPLCHVFFLGTSLKFNSALQIDLEFKLREKYGGQFILIDE